MLKKIARRTRRQLPHIEIQLTPLIDTALTLLVIFMITAPIVQNGIKVNLARGQVKEDVGDRRELVVYVDKESTFTFNGKVYQQKELVEALKTAVGVQADRPVYIDADQAALCGKVFELVDDIKVIGGVQSVVFSTQRRA